ncbi:hypothetical protein J6590_107268, partial [Homalodisca vitripennis]
YGSELLSHVTSTICETLLDRLQKKALRYRDCLVHWHGSHDLISLGKKVIHLAFGRAPHLLEDSTISKAAVQLSVYVNNLCTLFSRSTIRSAGPWSSDTEGMVSCPSVDRLTLWSFVGNEKVNTLAKSETNMLIFHEPPGKKTALIKSYSPLIASSPANPGIALPSSHICAYNWVNEFKHGRSSTNDEHRSERPGETSTPEMIEKHLGNDVE